MEQKLNIGWIGLGNMGNPMAARILNAGHNLMVYNRTADKTKVLAEAGAVVAGSISELLSKADIIFTMLSDDAAVTAVYSNPELTRNATGKLFVDMSTIKPDTAITLMERANAAGGRFVSAPVSGSTKPAADGQLIILGSGTIEDFEEAKAIFNILGKKSVFLGPIGVGSKAKLAINYLVALMYLGLAETVLFAEQNGISRADMLDIINEGALGGPLTKSKTSLIINDEYPPAFALKLMEKDVRLAIEEGADFPLTKSMHKAYLDGMEKGFADADVMAVLKSIQK
ncbi:NAD(P)-dependent oxidoreductase [Pedobacter sp. AW1-32]|uniref:NAD(P)-dependent oxidoreductase n=1 Tax=Pedobacter sp. AW1-32 TaxID=3383026 RepID=UPI003FEF8255